MNVAIMVVVGYGGSCFREIVSGFVALHDLMNISRSFEQIFLPPPTSVFANAYEWKSTAPFEILIVFSRLLETRFREKPSKVYL